MSASQRARSNTWDSIYHLVEHGIEGIAEAVESVSSSYLPPGKAEPESRASDILEAVIGSSGVPPKTRLFGTSLLTLLCDDHRCSMARLDARIGLPTQIEHMLNILHHSIDVPDLFRRRGSKEEMEMLRTALEEERLVPAGTRVHAVAHCLLQWLYELPEPLLGYERFDAFLAVMGIESEVDRIRNLSLMIDEVEWWNKSVLIEVVKLFSTALRPENASINGLTVSAVVVVLTPVLLRSQGWVITPTVQPLPGVKRRFTRGGDRSSIEKACLMAAIVGA
jgi:hypothetical protein